MGNVESCFGIIKDDFNNVLILAKGKKTDPIIWQCVGRKKKGKETNDKCINNSVKEELNTLLFDLEELKEIVVNGERIQLYTGKLKEYMNLGKNVKAIEWVNETNIDKFEFLPGQKEIYLEYFKLV